jgi:hypothetical protein
VKEKTFYVDIGLYEMFYVTILLVGETHPLFWGQNVDNFFVCFWDRIWGICKGYTRNNDV